MMKHLIVVLASAVLGAACGLPSLDALGGDEAEVEIVNADASDTADDAANGLGSAVADEDGKSGDDADEIDPLAAGSDDADTDATEEPAPADAPATAAVDEPVIEVAAAGAIQLDGDEDRMTLSPKNPTGGWGQLILDGARSQKDYEGKSAELDSKFVIVEYQLWGEVSGNFFDDAFRMYAGGEAYSPLFNINEIPKPGAVINAEVAFEVPRSETVLQLEAGMPAGSADGFTTLYNIDMSPATEEDQQSEALALSDADVEAIGGEIELLTAESNMTIDTGEPTGGWATLSVDEVVATAKIEDVGAGPRHKFIIIDFQLLGGQSDNFFEPALRLKADDEWYGPLDTLNEIIDVGEVFNGSVTFRVPREAEEFIFEGGVPERWTDGLRAAYGFSLWDASEGIDDTDTDTDAAAATVPVEAEATDIALIGSEERMTTDTSDPRGWGTLSIDRAYTTAKIEQNGARTGFKFLIIEYQLLGGESDNLFEQAFRLEAEDELYSPLNNINEILDAGEVFNGSLVFEVPIEAATVVLEGGVVPGSIDGFTTTSEISFG